MARRKRIFLVPVCLMMFAASCTAQPNAVLPKTPELVLQDALTSPVSKPRLIRHILIGRGKSVYEFQNVFLNTVFEEGTVDGILIVEAASQCDIYSFSIYDFDPMDGVANQLSINGELFQKLELASLVRTTFSPARYSKAEVIALFEEADRIIARHNALLREKVTDVVDHVYPHGLYNLLWERKKERGPNCEERITKLTPEILQRFVP